MSQPNHLSQHRVGLLGGSFNPAHDGHRELSLAALKRLQLDAVWWLVTPGNPLKDKTLYGDYDERLRLARDVASHPEIIISDFEHRHSLQYTADTLPAIKGENPNTKFVWLMGADSLATFHLWRDWERIADATPIAVFNRPGFETAATTSKAAETLKPFRIPPTDHEKLFGVSPPAWIFFDDLNNPLSSTALRQSKASEKEH